MKHLVMMCILACAGVAAPVLGSAADVDTEIQQMERNIQVLEAEYARLLDRILEMEGLATSRPTYAAEIDAVTSKYEAEVARLVVLKNEYQHLITRLRADQPSSAAVTSDRNPITDMLASAERDLLSDRLTFPPGINAYEGFTAVLAIDPGNLLAQRGIDRIVVRQIELAREAGNRGEVDIAEAYLREAQSIRPGSAYVQRGYAQLYRDIQYKRQADLEAKINERGA